MSSTVKPVFNINIINFSLKQLMFYFYSRGIWWKSRIEGYQWSFDTRCDERGDQSLQFGTRTTQPKSAKY